jgi:putative transposase
MVRRRGGCKRVGTRARMPVPLAPNDRWSLDLVSDQSVCGRRFRIFAIFDDCTRECLVGVADTSLSGLRVARELDLLIAWRGRTKTIVSDNGTELTSKAILCWAGQKNLGWHYIDPGKPVQNAFLESFNGLLRDEFLNVTLFTSLMQAPQAARKMALRLQSGSAAFKHRLACASDLRFDVPTPRGQGAALRKGSAPWPVAATVYDVSGCQTLAESG